MAASQKKGLKIFYSYSHEDHDYRKQLDSHLSNLKWLYNLQTWFDRQIKAGDNWETVLEENLNTADLIFLLISPAFMSSNYCYNKELARALERHARGEAKVIPIIVRQVHWANAPFSHIQVLPTGARPVKSWADPDEAFYDVVVEVEKTIQNLLTLRQAKECFEKGVALHELQKYEEAIIAYDQAIHFDPDGTIAYNGKGNAFRGLKRYEEALVAYEQAILLDPNFAMAYSGKGTALWDLKRYEEALVAYEQAILLDPNFAPPYCGKGNAFRGLKRYEEALAAYEQAILLDPNFAMAYNNKSITLNKLKRPKEAEEAFQKAQELKNK